MLQLRNQATATMSNCSQTGDSTREFLRSQTLLLKSLLKDKGGQPPRLSAVRELSDGADLAATIERDMQALVELFNDLLLEPRPFNLRIVRQRGLPQLAWRVSNGKGDQVVRAIYSEAGADVLSNLPDPTVAAIAVVEEWRLVLNTVTKVLNDNCSTFVGLLERLSELESMRKSRMQSIESN